MILKKKKKFPEKVEVSYCKLAGQKNLKNWTILLVLND